MSNSTYSLYQYLLMNKGNVDTTLFVLGPAVADAAVAHKITFTLPQNPKHPAFSHQLQSKITRALKRRAAERYVNLSTSQAAKICSQWPIYALSDGLSDLTLFPKYLKAPAIKHCYATASAAAPDTPTDKLSIIDLKKAWCTLSHNEKDRIAAVFGIDAKELDLLKQKKVILITQPLSEDGIVTESDKQRLYQSILSNYNPNEVVIKPHPREKTNWATVFPGTPIISRCVPAELLSDMIDLKKVCTFFLRQHLV